MAGLATTEGVCPACEGVGPVGGPCSERACRKRGWHHIPRAQAARLAERAGDPDPAIGRRIGDFLLVDQLGAGGFGAVYLALQAPRFLLKAALKLMHASHADPAMAEMMLQKFQNEGDALALLDHPNIVRLLKYGAQGGTPYLVMEFVDGARTLRSEVRALAVRGVHLEPPTARHILTQTLHALGSAHRRGIVHRDLKPENVMLQPVEGDPNFVRILDFGLAKFVEERTQTSVAMGTPMYMAPEQIDRRDIGPWTDLYAVGVIAFELLTGRRPYAGRTQQELLGKKLDPAYDPTRCLADLDIPNVALAFFRRALARKPADRFRSSAELLGALSAVFEVSDETRPLLTSGADMSGLLDASDLARIAHEGRGSRPVEDDAARDPELPRAAEEWLDSERQRLDDERRRLEAERRAFEEQVRRSDRVSGQASIEAGDVARPDSHSRAGTRGAAGVGSDWFVSDGAASAPAAGALPHRRRWPWVLAGLVALAAVSFFLFGRLAGGDAASEPRAPGERARGLASAVPAGVPAGEPPRVTAEGSPDGTSTAGPSPDTSSAAETLSTAGPTPAANPAPAAEAVAIRVAEATHRGGAPDLESSPPGADARAPDATATPAPDGRSPVSVVRIESRPEGARVASGGVVLGTTPLDLSLAGDEPRTVTLRRAGYRTARRTVTRADAPTVRVRLRRRSPKRAQGEERRPAGAKTKPDEPDEPAVRVDLF